MGGMGCGVLLGMVSFLVRDFCKGEGCAYADAYVRVDHENAIAALEADEVPAPEIEGMREPNFFGGSLTRDGEVAGTFAGIAPATEGIARGGGTTKRIAPTPVDRQGQPLVGPFGSTLDSAVKHARSLSPEERKAGIVKLQRELVALKIAEDEVEEAGSEDSEDGVDDETDDPASNGVRFTYTWGKHNVCTYISRVRKGGDEDKRTRRK
jgi:hypothetical protein